MTTRPELTGRDLFEAFPDNPEAPEAHAVRNLRASLGRVLDHGHPDQMPAQRYDIRDRDGRFEERWWELVNIPVFQDGRLVSILHHVADVTARQRHFNAAAAGRATLTRRERDVLDAFAKGLTTKQVAAEIGLSAKAIEYYRLRLFDKLGVATQGALIRIGVLASI
jgi:DNA-binding CsgD family transcriptional regulator